MKTFRNQMPGMFWLESLLGLVSAALFVLTVLVPDWIERLFGASPDAADGSTEWRLALSFAVIAVVLLAFAGRTWRRRTRLPQSI